jgi:hypothetical protein
MSSQETLLRVRGADEVQGAATRRTGAGGSIWHRPEIGRKRR